MYNSCPDEKFCLFSVHRTGPFEVSADLEESMEFVEPEEAGPAEESGDEEVTDEETDLGTDWETVPSPRFCDIPSQVNRKQTKMLRTNDISVFLNFTLSVSSSSQMISLRVLYRCHSHLLHLEGCLPQLLLQSLPGSERTLVSAEVRDLVVV